MPPRARRLRRLPRSPLAPPLDVRVAATPRARLLGLARLDAGAVAGTALLLPRTRSIHTFGMRFALDLVWLDGAGRVVRVDRAVAPRRLRACRTARAVLELPAGGAQAWATGAPLERSAASAPGGAPSSSSSGAGLPR